MKNMIDGEHAFLIIFDEASGFDNDLYNCIRKFPRLYPVVITITIQMFTAHMLVRFVVGCCVRVAAKMLDTVTSTSLLME